MPLPPVIHPRIGVVLPLHRTWMWHQKSILLLQRVFDVDVFTTGCMSRYPFFLKLWMRLETKLFGESELVRRISIPAKQWGNAQGSYTFVLNLSEAPITYKNAPVLELKFDGGLDSLRLFAKLIARKNPYLSFQAATDDRPVVGSYLAIQDRVVLIRGLQLSFARLVALTERVARHVVTNTESPIPPDGIRITFSFLAARFLLFILHFAYDKINGIIVRRFRRLEHWSVALLPLDSFDSIDNFPLCRFAAMVDDGRRMYADPFLIAEGGNTWLFVEEFDYSSGKGVISCTRVMKGSGLATPRPVLVRPYHLSYPFVFRHQGEIFMIPETGSNRTLELYRAISFPDDWVLRQTLIEDMELYDATLLQHNEKWWIFASLTQLGGSSQDELVILYSESLYGPWRPHPLNPVKSDCRSARPAGKIVVRGDRLLRPAQNCEKGYGSGLVWLEIEELTTESFREKELARWDGVAVKAKGLHTFNYDDGTAAIDIARSVWKRPWVSTHLTVDAD